MNEEHKNKIIEQTIRGIDLDLSKIEDEQLQRELTIRYFELTNPYLLEDREKRIEYEEQTKENSQKQTVALETIAKCLMGLCEKRGIGPNGEGK